MFLFVCCFLFFVLPSTSLWGVYSETFIHHYNIPLAHSFTRLCMIPPPPPFFSSHVCPADLPLILLPACNASPLGPSRFSNPLNSHHVAIRMFSPAPGLKEQDGPLTFLDSQRRGHLVRLHPHPLGDNSLSVSCATSDFIACSFSGTVNTAEFLKDSQKIRLCCLCL